MTHAPLDTPARHTVLRSFAGHLDADPEAVYARLVALLRPTDAAGGRFLAHPGTCQIVLQGDWWYRGEYRVRPDGDGSIVEYEILNVAPRWSWAGAWIARSAVRAAPGVFQRLLSAVAQTPDGAPE